MKMYISDGLVDPSVCEVCRVYKACYRASAVAIVSASAISDQGPVFQLFVDFTTSLVVICTTKAAVLWPILEPSV
jgi:hypothetical protein